MAEIDPSLSTHIRKEFADDWRAFQLCLDGISFLHRAAEFQEMADVAIKPETYVQHTDTENGHLYRAIVEHKGRLFKVEADMDIRLEHARRNVTAGFGSMVTVLPISPGNKPFDPYVVLQRGTPESFEAAGIS